MNDEETKNIFDAINNNESYSIPTSKEERFVERLLQAFVCGMLISSSIVIAFIV